MDTTAFKAENLPSLTYGEALRLRKRMFEEMGTNTPMFAAFMNLLPNVGVTIKTAEGYYVYKNTYALEFANLKSEKAILGKRAQDIYPPRLWHMYVEQEEKVLRTGIPYTNKIHGFPSDHSNNPNRSAGFPVLDQRGRTIGLMTAFTRARTDNQVPGWHDQIKDVITHVNTHFAENIQVDEMAATARMSRSSFQHLFTALTKTPPHVYLATVRINAAKTLLETTDKPIVDIATETGFFDQSHFIKTFKKLTGLTPAKYRKRHLAI